MAMNKALETLDELKGNAVDDLRDQTKVAQAISTSVCSKQYGYEQFLSGLIAQACSKSSYSLLLLLMVQRLRKRKVFKIYPEGIHEKLRKQFRDPQRVPFMLDKTRKPLFPQLGTK